MHQADGAALAIFSAATRNHNHDEEDIFMTNELQHSNLSTSVSRFFSRILMAALAAGVLLFSAAISAQSQQTEATKPPTFSVLYAFKGGADGVGPGIGIAASNLALDGDGNVYGTTFDGGELSSSYCSFGGCGVVFKVDRAGNESVLHTFTGPPDGAGPLAGVIRDEEGNLYGAAYDGGLEGSVCNGCGTIFKIDRAGNETSLYNFSGTPDGISPAGVVIRDSEGNFYGTTQFGGASAPGSVCSSTSFACGTVFRLDRTGKETVLHSFSDGADGSGPQAGLVRDEEGNLYGTTPYGGTSGNGVVFKLDPAGKETILYTFTGLTDGGAPFGGLTRDSDGTLYGMTSEGGLDGNGVIFKLNPHGKFSVLYSFTGGADGGVPYGTLVRDGSDLYGTTYFGGIYTAFQGDFNGVVFKLDATSKETVVYSFGGLADGANPNGNLTVDAEGNLYGTTQFGGDLANQASPCYGFGCGVVFKIALHDKCDESANKSEILQSRSR